MRRYFRARIEEVVAKAGDLKGEELTEFLTKENQETVRYTREQTEKLWGKMLTESINMSKLTFNMDKNL